MKPTGRSTLGVLPRLAGYFSVSVAGFFFAFLCFAQFGVPYLYCSKAARSPQVAEHASDFFWACLPRLLDIGLRNNFGKEMRAVGIIIVAMFVAGYLFRLSKRQHARTGDQVLSDREGRPVLYLRSFKEDFLTNMIDFEDRSLLASFVTEEEYLEQALRRLGPVVAIGVPGEKLPQLGAARIYVEHSEWKARVQDLMKDAILVVLRIGTTENFLWEYKEALDRVRPERIVLLITHPAQYEAFRQLAPQLVTTRPLPAYPKYALRRRTFAEWFVESVVGLLFPQPPGYESKKKARWTPRSWSLSALVYFQSDGSPCFIPLKRPRRRDTIASSLADAMRPIYQQLGVLWRPPATDHLWVPLSFGVLGALIFVIWETVFLSLQN
jgi:hypothetical protein